MVQKQFTVERSRVVQASPERVRSLLVDFHQWRSWSPWEDVDPQMHRAYAGPQQGVGATYSWSGNRKAGAGSMEVLDVTEREVDIALAFTKPFKAQNSLAFLLEPSGDATHVTWRMTGARPLMMRLMGPLLDMDKLVGKDFEKGLEQLDAAARS